MKKIISMLLVTILLGTSTIINTKVSASVAVAYSIGVNHGWIGSHTGDFTNNVEYAADAYGTLGLFSSYYNTKPTVDYMRGKRANSDYLMEQDVLFFNGHANEKNLLFNHSNDGGDYATGVYWEKDYDSPTTEFKYAGIKQHGMDCDLVSFVGCSTAKGSDNLTKRSVDQGANTAVGFDSTIYSRTSSGEKWLRAYNDKLADGKSVNDAINYATEYSPSSDLGDDVVIKGSSSNTIVVKLTSNNDLKNSKEEQEYISSTVNISKDYSNKKVDIKKLKKYDNFSLNDTSNEFNDIISIIKSNDEIFNPSDYILTVQEYCDGNGVIKFRYTINDDIKTSSCYLIFIKDNKIERISDKAKHKDIVLSSNNNGDSLSKEEIIEKVEKHKQESKDKSILKKVKEIEYSLKEDNIDLKLNEKNDYYFYDYDANKLSLIVETAHESNLDGAIISNQSITEIK